MNEKHNALEELETIKNETWDIIKDGEFWSFIRHGKVSKEFYFTLMSQIFNYIQHTPKSQSMAAIFSKTAPVELARFCYHHSFEEVGHEYMIVDDLHHLNYTEKDIRESLVLRETKAFIGYIYYLSIVEGPVARLGLSYWIEGSYSNVMDGVLKIQSDLELTKEQMSWFFEHERIDQSHFKNVCKTIERHGQLGLPIIKQTLRNTLLMFGDILDAVSRTQKI